MQLKCSNFRQYKIQTIFNFFNLKIIARSVDQDESFEDGPRSSWPLGRDEDEYELS